MRQLTAGPVVVVATFYGARQTAFGVSANPGNGDPEREALSGCQGTLFHCADALLDGERVEDRGPGCELAAETVWLVRGQPWRTYELTSPIQLSGETGLQVWLKPDLLSRGWAELDVALDDR